MLLTAGIIEIIARKRFAPVEQHTLQCAAGKVIGDGIFRDTGQPQPG